MIEILYTQNFSLDELSTLVEYYLEKFDEDSIEYQHANKISDEILGARIKGYKSAKLCYDSMDCYTLIWSNKSLED